MPQQLRVDEDKKVLSDAEHVLAMVESRGWEIVKGKLDSYISDIQNISNVLAAIEAKKGDSTELLNELRVRQAVAETLFNWMKVNVYGAIEQARATQTAVYESSEQFIDRS